MICCALCQVEMKCIKNGLGARWGEAHVYPGDQYECPECKASVLLCVSGSCMDLDRKIETIQMKEKRHELH